MKGQQGMALLVVMLTIAALAIIVHNNSALWRSYINQAMTLQSESQMRQDLLGAEKHLLHQLSSAPFLSGQAGVIELGTTRVRWRTVDIQACFNLNSLATQPKSLEDGSLYHPESHRIFQNLLSQQGISAENSETITKMLAETIKPDVATKKNKRFVSLAQIWALPVMDPALINTLKPLFCLDGGDRIQVSINGLMPNQASLLSALTEGKLPVEAATLLISNRPAQGWQHFEQLTQQTPDASHSGLAGLQPFLTFKSQNWLLMLETDDTTRVALHSQLSEKNGSYVVQQRHWKTFGV